MLITEAIMRKIKDVKTSMNSEDKVLDWVIINDISINITQATASFSLIESVSTVSLMGTETAIICGA